MKLFLLIAVALVGSAFLMPFLPRAETKNVYVAKIIPKKILVVVGHDNIVWGSKFLKTKEVDLNRILARDLYNFLKNDPLFDPTVTQVDGDYIPELKNFLDTEKENIVVYRAERKKEFPDMQDNLNEDVQHNKVTNDVANKLYGTSLWAQKEKFDLLVHVHFNDYPGRPKNTAGKYRGFVMYVPDPELKNGEASKPFAEAVYARLLSTEKPSNLPVEKEGILESRELIGLGARNSLSMPSIIVEYAYIAEPRLYGDARTETIRNMAYQTYLGVKDVYFPDNK